MRDETRRWLGYAQDDLAAGHREATHAQGVPRIICFHAQQAAEKGLKAALIEHTIPVLKTHDLTKLARLLPAAFTLSVEEEALALLSAYAVATRYADDLSDVQPAEADEALSIAARIVSEVVSWLGEP